MRGGREENDNKNLGSSFNTGLLNFAYATNPVTLEPGKAIERTIAGGEAHSYTFTLASGMYTFIDVEQKDINLTVTIFAADGQKLRLADVNSAGSAEQISLIAESTASYRVEIAPSDKLSRDAGYGIKLGESRPATDQDKSRVEAEKLTEAGAQLLVPQTAASRGEAADKFQQSITFWRVAKDTLNEARALRLIAYTFNLLGQHQKAQEIAETGLPLAKAVNDRQVEASLLDTIGDSYNGRGERKKALEFFPPGAALAICEGSDRIG